VTEAMQQRSAKAFAGTGEVMCPFSLYTFLTLDQCSRFCSQWHRNRAPIDGLAARPITSSSLWKLLLWVLGMYSLAFTLADSTSPVQGTRVMVSTLRQISKKVGAILVILFVVRSSPLTSTFKFLVWKFGVFFLQRIVLCENWLLSEGLQETRSVCCVYVTMLLGPIGIPTKLLSSNWRPTH
jgi:hypothetical protein